MSPKPLVSVIVIFLNAQDFLKEAVESVLSQTYEQWELLLVDDGSVDKSTQIARDFAVEYPKRVIYIEHPNHQNKGKGISRNLGLHQARGKYVAFLDADDIWLPNKLEEQVKIFESYPEAGMLYGNTLYWYSWTGQLEDKSKDFIPKLGVKTGIPMFYPELLPLYLRGKAAVPCTCSIIVKRKVIETVKGFDETHPGINNFYEDQAFYAKICFETPVVAVNACWDKYRQRSSLEIEDIKRLTRQELLARKSFLNWLSEYMNQLEIEEPNILLALQKELWLQQIPVWLSKAEKLKVQIRWIKKWILRLEELLLPESVRYQLWVGNRDK